MSNMQNLIQEFEYEGQVVEFDLSRNGVMVNATEMAKIFDARINNFFENQDTKRFIEACLNNRNSGYLGIKNRDDLYVSRQRSGTWMHRVLALKFAAWLNPDFEVWVYMTIDQLLFGKLREQEKRASEQAQKEARRRVLEAKFGAMDDYRELQSLRASNQHYFKETRRQADIQLEIFTEQIAPKPKDNSEDSNDDE